MKQEQKTISESSSDNRINENQYFFCRKQNFNFIFIILKKGNNIWNECIMLLS